MLKTKIFSVTVALVFIVFGFLYLNNSALAQNASITRFDVSPSSIPSTASTINLNFVVQIDANLDCNESTVGQGSLGWVVWYDARPGTPIIVRQSTIPLPFSPNPKNLDFTVSNFTPHSAAVNSGNTEFQAAIGCGESAPYANSQSNIAVSSPVPVTIRTGSGGAGQASVNFNIVQNTINAGSPVDFRLTVQQLDSNLDCSYVPGSPGNLEWIVWYQTSTGSAVVRRGSTPLPLSPNPKPLDFTESSFQITQVATSQQNLSFRAAAGCDVSPDATSSGNAAVSSIVSRPVGSAVNPNVCGIADFTITRTGGNNFNYRLTTSPACNSRLASIELFTQNTQGTQISSGVVANGPIQNGSFTGPLSINVTTQKFFLKASVAGDGTRDSRLLDNNPNAAPDPGTGGGGGGSTCGGAGQPACQPGTTQNFLFSIPNPLQANNFVELIGVITTWLFTLAIPIAVAMIVYAGVMFLTSRGEPAKVTKAKQILLYAVIGLAIILIGKGFITLIESVLELGNPSSSSSQPILPIGGGGSSGSGGSSSGGGSGSGSTGTGGTTAGTVGKKCSRDRDCFSGFKCKNDICQRQTGNLVGEPCKGGTNCDAGLACDQTSGASVVIDDQTLGTCFQTSATGARIGDVCQRDSDCISGLKCNQICQRKNGNLNSEACLKTSSPSNCRSRACHTIGAEIRGDCVEYSGT